MGPEDGASREHVLVRSAKYLQRACLDPVIPAFYPDTLLPLLEENSAKHGSTRRVPLAPVVSADRLADI